MREKTLVNTKGTATFDVTVDAFDVLHKLKVRGGAGSYETRRLGSDVFLGIKNKVKGLYKNISVFSYRDCHEYKLITDNQEKIDEYIKGLEALEHINWLLNYLSNDEYCPIIKINKEAREM